MEICASFFFIPYIVHGMFNAHVHKSQECCVGQSGKHKELNDHRAGLLDPRLRKRKSRRGVLRARAAGLRTAQLSALIHRRYL